jgi:hypothetical protein
VPKVSISGCRGTLAYLRLPHDRNQRQAQACGEVRVARRSSRWRPLPGARWVEQSVPASDRCLRIATILHTSRPAPLSATSASRTNARTPASTTGSSTGPTPALRRRHPPRAARPHLRCRPMRSRQLWPGRTSEINGKAGAGARPKARAARIPCCEHGAFVGTLRAPM